MFKKKQKQEIELGQDTMTDVYYPDIEGNLELPEEDRFQIAVKKLSNMEKLKAIKIVDGHVHNDEDLLFRSSVIELINPPVVNGERDLTLDDIITAEELYTVFQGLYIAIMKLNANKMNKKKS